MVHHVSCSNSDTRKVLRNDDLEGWLKIPSEKLVFTMKEPMSIVYKGRRVRRMKTMRSP